MIPSLPHDAKRLPRPEVWRGAVKLEEVGMGWGQRESCFCLTLLSSPFRLTLGIKAVTSPPLCRAGTASLEGLL